MSRTDFTVNVDEYLATNKYEVDEENAHIELAEQLPDAEFDKLIMVCPAALYKRDAETGEKTFDYAGCLECGTCRPGSSRAGAFLLPGTGRAKPKRLTTAQR